MTAMLRNLYLGLGSLKLTVVLLALLALLTYVGTLSQVEHGLFVSQQRYFNSWLVLHPVRHLRIPLPGGQTVMSLLFVNLLIGGFVRMRRTWRLLGVYVVHAGIALLLIGGLVTLRWSDDGYIALYEGDRANFFESHHLWELAIGRSGGGPTREFVVDEKALLAAVDQRVAVHHPELPFTVIIDAYAPNSHVRGAGAAIDGAEEVDGVVLLALPPAPEKEQELPGAYVTLRTAGGQEQRLILRGSSMLLPQAATVPVGDETWTIDLRKRRYALPFTVRLDDFRKEDHPGTTLPRSFESDVTQFSSAGERQVLIEMNAPLRDAGYVVYQSGWGPQGPMRPARFYSQFAVVRNPSDQWPTIACAIIALGLVLHFGRSLWRYVRREVDRREETAPREAKIA